MRRTRFIFAGGGTGGHLYPGLAIAERLRERMGDAASCLFVCSERPIDARILTSEGAEHRIVRARPVGVRPRTLARFLWTWGESVRDCRRIIREAHGSFERVVVVAMGGFVAAPMMMAARREQEPLTMLNLDAVPGKANRWIARHASRVFSTFAVEGYPGWTVIPPIIRRAALPPASKAECRRALGLDPDAPTLMVTGGSQGAVTINQTIASVFAGDVPPAGWQVLHQCGRADPGSGGSVEELRAAYARVGAGVRAVVEEFTRDMGRWWGAADLAVGRAGAGTVAEAWAAGVPTIFMPYPYHADQHQRLNALPLERAGAAVILQDRVEATVNARQTAPEIRALMADAARREAMRAALARLGPADGAQRVAAALAEAG